MRKSIVFSEPLEWKKKELLTVKSWKLSEMKSIPNRQLKFC